MESAQWREVVRRLNDMTGLPVASFQTNEDGDSFIVDGNLGRNLGQQALKTHAPAHKELTLPELLAASANAELHVVGMYFPDMHNPGKPVDVEVQSSEAGGVGANVVYGSCLECQAG